MSEKQNKIWNPFVRDLPVYELATLRELPSDARPTVVIWESRPEAGEALVPFLHKIFEALPVQSEREVFLLALTPGQRLGLLVLLRQLQARRIIVFGISPPRLGLAVAPEKYELFRLGMRRYLWADDLQAIREEREAGGRSMSGPLWKALQTMFKER